MKINPKYLPSRKIQVLIFFLLIIVVTIFIFSYKKDVVSSVNGLTTREIGFSSSTIKFLDTDSDGLSDWEEALYGTNKNNKDTDNDGTDDYTEIKEGRNPNLANTSKDVNKPNDLFGKETITWENISKKNSSTERNINLNIDTEPSIINYVSKTTSSDLYFVEPTEQSIKDYMKFYYVETQQIALFFKKDIDIIEAKEIDEINFSKLITLLDLTTESFKKAHLPSDSVWGEKYHLEIINDMEKMSSILRTLPSISKDKAQYNSTLNIYYSIREDLAKVLSVLDDIFNIKRNNN